MDFPFTKGNQELTPFLNRKRIQGSQALVMIKQEGEVL